MKLNTLITFGLLSVFFIFSYGKCFTDFADSIVINLDGNNLLTEAYFVAPPCPKPTDAGVKRSYTVQEIEDSLAKITTRLNLKSVTLNDVVNYSLSSFDLSIVSPGVKTLSFEYIDYVSLTIGAPGLQDTVIFRQVYSRYDPQYPNLSADTTRTITVRVPDMDIKRYLQAAINVPGKLGRINYTLNLFTNRPILLPTLLRVVPHGKIELSTKIL